MLFSLSFNPCTPERRQVVEYYPPPATALSGQGTHMLPAVIRVPTRYVDLNGAAAEVACTRRNILVRDKFTCQVGSGRGSSPSKPA
jgi:hypothetical protein